MSAKKVFPKFVTPTGNFNGDCLNSSESYMSYMNKIPRYSTRDRRKHIVFRWRKLGQVQKAARYSIKISFCN